MMPMGKDTKSHLNKWDNIEIKSFCMAKETWDKTKTTWKTIIPLSNQVKS